MTKQQIKWASQHDWYVCHSDILKRVTVWEQETMQTVCFTDFKELKTWAGY